MESSGGGNRRRQSITGERTESSNLRDFLRVKDDDNGRTTLAGLTLRAVLTNDKSPSQVQSNRTLLDIIIDDSSGGKDSKKSWKAFKDKLRLRRAGAAWTSSVPIPASDIPSPQSSNRMMTRGNSNRFSTPNIPMTDDPTPEPETTADGGQTRGELNSVPSNRAMLLRRNTSRIPERQASRLFTGGDNVSAESAEQHQQNPSADETAAAEGVGETAEATAEGGGGEGGEPPARMSLMALLAETDRQMGLDGSAYMMDDEEEEDEEEESGGGDGSCSGGGPEYNNCCVCMVRHKGAAFIPCGHTFCRLCSRELWVQRGNCPLCNNYILEILDIF